MTKCILWEGATNGDGYGVVRFNGVLMLVHRVTYRLKKGRIPAGKEVHHTCENRRCRNPEHLVLKTHRAHMRLHRRAG